MSAKFDDIPVVIAEFDEMHDQYIYIVCKIQDSDSDRTKDIVCIKNADEFNRHAKILAWLEENVTSSCAVEVLGGGHLYVGVGVELIIFAGYSCEFGEEPDRNRTWEMLEKAYPDFTIL